VNGRELVAADVKYSFDRGRQEVAHRQSAGTGGRHRDAGQVHGARDPRRRLRTLRALPRRAVELHHAARGRGQDGDFKAAESLIGCGPFVLERYEPGVKAVFARNPSYYVKGLPYLDKVSGSS